MSTIIASGVRTPRTPKAESTVTVSTPSVSMEQMIAQMKAENEALRVKLSVAEKAVKVSGEFKVSAKGAVSVYGLGQFPVTLYKEQWMKLLAKADAIKAFMEEHDAELSVKVKAAK